MRRNYLCNFRVFSRRGSAGNPGSKIALSQYQDMIRDLLEAAERQSWRNQYSNGGGIYNSDLTDGGAGTVNDTCRA